MKKKIDRIENNKKTFNIKLNDLIEIRNTINNYR